MRKIRWIALSFVLMVVMLGITGCKIVKVEDENNTATGGNEVEVSYDMNAKFSKSDLVVEDLKVGMSIEEVKGIMGEPDSITNGDSYDIYGESIVYKYGDLQLGFYKHDGVMVLSQASTENYGYTFAKGLRVGMSKDEVISYFYKESENESELRNVYSQYDVDMPYGRYLYGHGIDTADAVKESDKLEYAVINKYNYDSSRPGATYMIEYSYLEPPYESQYASIADERCVLVFDVNSDDKVTCIRWYYYPEMQ